MLHILLVTVQRDILHSFAQGLSADPEVRLDEVYSGTEALSIVRSRCPHLVVIDSGVPNVDPLDLVRQMISVNAMVNTAVVSTLSEDDFHEKSEGLGILCRLPLESGDKEARELIQKLRALIGPVG